MFKLLSLLLCSFSVNNSYHFEEKISYTDQVIAEEILGINQNSYAYQVKDQCFLVVNDKHYELQKGELVVVDSYQDYIFILVKENNTTTLYQFNQKNQKIKNYQFNCNLLTIEIAKDFIMVGGCKDNNGVLYKIDYELKEFEEYSYGGDNYEAITNIKISQDYIYVGIKKSGISNNSGFVNIGTKDQIKSLIMKLDLEFQLIDVFYFNYEQPVEEIISFSYSNDRLEVVIKTEIKYYYHLLDLDFNIINYQELDTQDRIFFLPNYKTNSSCLFLTNQHDTISLCLNDKQCIIYNTRNSGFLKDLVVYQGNLYLYFISEQKIEIICLSEYQIVKNEVIVVNHFYPHYNFNDYFIIESFFEKLTINQKEISPFFSNTINGNYTINYEVVKENQETININGTLIVEEYTNFINNGVYEKGKVLEFFGNAVINNKVIYNGMTLDQCGTYEITIINANQVTKKYLIHIVEKYYKKEEENNLEYEIITNDNASITYLLSNTVVVKDLIINGKSYSDYEFKNQNLKVNFTKTGSYYLDKIIYLENELEKILEINQLIDVSLLKQEPTINIDKIITEDFLNINLNINDSDQTFEYIKVVTKNLGQVINEQIITNTLEHQISVNSQNQLLIYFGYFLGGNQIEEELIYEYITSSDIFFRINNTYENEQIVSTNINIKLPKQHNLIKLMKVHNVDILGHFNHPLKIDFKKTIIITSLIIIVLDISYLSIFFIFKKRKKLTSNKL